MTEKTRTEFQKILDDLVDSGEAYGAKRTCMAVWETFQDYEKAIRGSGGGTGDGACSDIGTIEVGLACLDKLKENLEEALPFGPDEVT